MLGPGLFPVTLWFVVMAAIWIGIPVAIFVFARRLLRAIERRPVRESQTAELAERLQRLEERLYDIQDENERLGADQRFTRELLMERQRETEA